MIVIKEMIAQGQITIKENEIMLLVLCFENDRKSIDHNMASNNILSRESGKIFVISIIIFVNYPLF